ncbi:MAG: pitrilysin family protein [Opitutales bacterium]
MPSEYIATASGRILDSLLNEKVERFTLPNGLVVVFKEDHSTPVSSVQLWVKTGSIHEGENLGSGLSHFLEHMLFKGTEKRAGREISSLVQANGGTINAYTTFDRTVYHIDIPSDQTAVALDILADAVFHSRLPEDEVEKERDVILREIDMYLDDPMTQLSQSLFDTAFREHPYRAPVIGYREVFESVTREELLHYYHTRYVPNNAVLVIAGDWTVGTCREEVDRYLGGLRRKKIAPVFIPAEPEQLSFRQNQMFADVQVSHSGLGFKIPGLAHPDSPALKILASVLGYGSSAILWKSLRDRQKLVHDIDVSTWNPGSAGLFFISFLADPQNQEKAIDAIWQELEEVTRTGIPKTLIQKTIRQALVGEVNVRKTVQGQAARLGAAEVIVGDLDYPRVYLQQLAAVTPDDLQRVCKQYLRRDRLTAVSLNPEATRTVLPDTEQLAAREPVCEKVALPNKATLLLQPDHRLPSVHFRVILRGGPIYEAPAARGATSLLATLLAKDTEKRTKEQVAEAIEGVGGAFSEFSGNNTFGFAIEVLPDDVDLALDLMGEALLKPAFLPETFELERDSEIASLKEDLDEIVDRGRKLLRARFFGDHPFATEPTGTVESLTGMKREDIQALYEAVVSAENLVVSVVGDFDEKSLRRDLEKAVGAIPARGFSPKHAPFAGPATPGDFKEAMARKQAVVFEAYPDLGITDPRYPVGEVADELFSGMSSVLFERVREDLGLAYFVGSSRITGIDTGLFYFYAGTNPATVDPVVHEIKTEILRVQEGKVTKEELRRCQRRLKARKRMGLQSFGARAMDAGLNLIFGLPVCDRDFYDNRIDAVTLKDLQEFAVNHFQPEKKVLLVIGPDE